MGDVLRARAGERSVSDTVGRFSAYVWVKLEPPQSLTPDDRWWVYQSQVFFVCFDPKSADGLRRFGLLAQMEVQRLQLENKLPQLRSTVHLILVGGPNDIGEQRNEGAISVTSFTIKLGATVCAGSDD